MIIFLSIRSKSNSSGLSNQIEQKNRIKENEFNASQTRIDLIVMQKNAKKKDSRTYETIVMDENSTETKCSFGLSKFFNNKKTHLFGLVNKHIY